MRPYFATQRTSESGLRRHRALVGGTGIVAWRAVRTGLSPQRSTWSNSRGAAIRRPDWRLRRSGSARPSLGRACDDAGPFGIGQGSPRGTELCQSPCERTALGHTSARTASKRPRAGEPRWEHAPSSCISPAIFSTTADFIRSSAVFSSLLLSPRLDPLFPGTVVERTACSP